MKWVRVNEIWYQPVAFLGRAVGSGFEAAMVLVEKGQGLEFGLGRGLEIASDLLLECFLIALDGQEVVAASIEDSLGDLCIVGDGIDGDQSASDGQTLQEGGAWQEPLPSCAPEEKRGGLRNHPSPRRRKQNNSTNENKPVNLNSLPCPSPTTA